MSTATASTERLRFVEKVGYGFGDLASCLFWQTFTVFLLFFYTDVFGIAAAAAGTMIGLVRIVDLFADPVMGMIGDRTETRWGKFRPYLLWIAVPFGAIGFLTFLSPDLTPTAKLTYAYITYGAMMLIYTAINIPYGALMGVVTPNSLERTKLSSYRFLGAFTGNMVVQTFTVGLVKHFGAGNDRLGYRYTIGIYAVSAIVLFLGTFALTRERVQPARDQQTSLLRDLGDLMGNGPWLVLGVVGICANTWAVLKMASLVYFFKYYIGRETAVSMFMFWGTVFNILGVLATGWLTKLLGKRMLYLLATIGNVVTTGAYYFAGPNDLVFLYVMNVLGGFFSGPVSPLIWAMFADSADYSEWKTGRRATGLIFSAGTFSQKMGWTIGGMLAGLLLGYYGFQANVAQSVGSLHGIRLLVSLVPAAAAVLAAIVIYFYSIDEQKLKQITSELAERRARQQAVPANA
jgi:GPH family glycoside/pentoside/hexuronide:cation symporter